MSFTRRIQVADRNSGSGNALRKISGMVRDGRFRIDRYGLCSVVNLKKSSRPGNDFRRDTNRTLLSDGRPK